MREGGYLPGILCILVIMAQEGGQYTGAHLYFRKEYSAGVIFHTSGMGFRVEFGRRLSGFKKLILATDIYSLKHPKEVKVENRYIDGARPYTPGKEFSNYSWNVGIGVRKVIAVKDRAKGVEIAVSMDGGFSLLLRKPNYVIVDYPNVIRPEITRVERYQTDKHMPIMVREGAPWFWGLGELTGIPGGYLMGMLNVDMAVRQSRIFVLMVGFAVNVYAEKVELLKYQEKKNVFLNLFAGLRIGKKIYYGKGVDQET